MELDGPLLWSASLSNFSLIDVSFLIHLFDYYDLALGYCNAQDFFGTHVENFLLGDPDNLAVDYEGITWALSTVTMVVFPSLMTNVYVLGYEMCISYR